MEEMKRQEKERKRHEDEHKNPSNIHQLLNNMVNVVGGTFLMGCSSRLGGNDCMENAKPIHQVTLSSFSISKYVVTQLQWREVMDNNPSSFIGSENCPVESVSWDDVQEFIRKLNELTGKHYRLPTEAEWEYAARGGNKSCGYKYSGSNNIEDVAWYEGNSGSRTHPVGQKQPNELGLYDMSGNVREWCSDWHSGYSSRRRVQNNPKGPSFGTIYRMFHRDANRVIRGGGFRNISGGCCVWSRDSVDPEYYDRYDLGFRLVSP